MENLKEQQQILEKWKKSPLLFVKDVWGLVPQKPKPEYEDVWNYVRSLRGKEWEAAKKNVKASWFGDYDADNFRYTWYSFDKGKNITWQQELIMLSIEKAINRQAPNKISVVSGRGTGKTTSASWIILWFLYCYYDALIPCAAPTAQQLNDALWKELSIQIGKMPEGMKAQYEWISDHVRMKVRPASWYARAKTASKENPEALAGLHADNMLLVVDESSAVDDIIFNTAEGALTSDNAFVLLLSNPTRPTGYFFRTFNNPNWQNLQLSSIESPVVSPNYEGEKALSTGGRDSENYGIDVLGKFPTEDTMNSDGYLRLFSNTNIQWLPKTDDLTFGKDAVVGVDPSGEGDDITAIFIRDNFKGKMIFKESVSNPKQIAERIITIIDHYKLNARNVIIDNFGIGANVASEVSRASHGKHIITAVNVGEPCDYEDEKEQYMNKRALIFHGKWAKWIRDGGQMVSDIDLEQEMETIYSRRNLAGKMQIMPKVEMKKRGYRSPNCADAVALSFIRDIPRSNGYEKVMSADEEMLQAIPIQHSRNYDPFADFDI